MSEQNSEVSLMISSIDNVMSTDVSIFQVSKSAEIRNSIATMLRILNQETYSYVLDINDYIRNNVKDASFLKRSFIEKIHGNMGD